MIVETATHILAQAPIPDPPPIVPPGKLANASNLLLGVMKYGGLIAAAAMLMAAGIMMSLGRRRNNHMAVEGALAIPWTVVGISLTFGAVSLVGWVAA